MEEFRNVESRDLMDLEDISAMKWEEITMDAYEERQRKRRLERPSVDNDPTAKRRRRHKPMYRNEDGDTYVHSVILYFKAIIIIVGFRTSRNLENDSRNYQRKHLKKNQVDFES